MVVLRSYRAFVARLLDPLSRLSGLMLLVAVDAHHRYRAVAKEIVGKTILDIGGGDKSFFLIGRGNCVSLELRKLPGVQAVGSATSLPFRSNSFDCVLCVDTIEHIPRTLRSAAVLEMKRVARRRVIIHTPVQGGSTYVGRSYDLAFNEWHKLRKRKDERNTKEHIINIQPTARELEGQDFILKGTHNAALWMSCMKLKFGLREPLGALISHVYYLLNENRDHKPPFWGAVGIFDKSQKNFTRASN